MLGEGWVSSLGLEVANYYMYFSSYSFQSVPWCSPFGKGSGLSVLFPTLRLPQHPGDLAPAKTKIPQNLLQQQPTSVLSSPVKIVYMDIS